MKIYYRLILDFVVDGEEGSSKHNRLKLIRAYLMKEISIAPPIGATISIDDLWDKTLCGKVERHDHQFPRNDKEDIYWIIVKPNGYQDFQAFHNSTSEKSDEFIRAMEQRGWTLLNTESRPIGTMKDI